MLNGWYKGERAGSGTIDVEGARRSSPPARSTTRSSWTSSPPSAPSVGHCNTMGTASTMNALAEALGMSLPGCAAIPAPYRERGQIAYETGKRVVEMVREDLKPSDILTREAFENAIVVNSRHRRLDQRADPLNAIARHIGVELEIEDWETIGYDMPLLVNMQPAGKYLGEEYHRAGGVPAVMQRADARPSASTTNAMTVNGKTIGENCARATIQDAEVIRPYDKPLKETGRLHRAKGNLFDSAIMKTSVISDEFRERYLVQSRRTRTRSRAARSCSTGRRTITTASTIRRSKIDEHTHAVHPRHRADRLSGRGRGGEHAAAGRADQEGHHALPCIGDGRQSGTSGSPSILNASPEAAVGGGLALLKTGDRVRIDLDKGTANILISDGGARRAARRAAEARRLSTIPASQTPWQEIQRGMVDQLAEGMVLKPAVKYQRVAQKAGVPRNSH